VAEILNITFTKILAVKTDFVINTNELKWFLASNFFQYQYYDYMQRLCTCIGLVSMFWCI